MKSTKLIFISACIGMLLFGIGLITLGSVATGLQDKFHLDKISSGTLFSILPFGILTGSFLFGPFSDRYGYKMFLLLSCICMFIGFQGIAYAPSLNLLKLCIFLFGFGGGAINGATNAVVSDISETHKSANLSLLGVFFAIGALGMPAVMGILEKYFTYEVIVSAVSYLTLFAAVFFGLTRFPPPKQSQVPISKGIVLLKDNVLILIAFFLFCQSGFEGIINNWTTTYLSIEWSVSKSNGLYALSLYVTGMAVMRLMLGTALRRISTATIIIGSLVFLFLGSLLLQLSTSYSMSVAGLISLGIGLAAGFPVMLGLVGDRFAELSATAFSIVLTIALLGNMSINYLLGVAGEVYGIHHLITFTFTLSAIMMLLSFIILKRVEKVRGNR